MGKTALYALALLVGVVAWQVMPDGPWYRELGGGFLLVVSADLFDFARKRRKVPHA